MKSIKRSIAYLKGEITNNEESIELSTENSPVLRDFGNGLLAAYLVNDGDQFSYVQHRDLAESQIDKDDLHYIGLENLALLVNDKLQIRQTEGIYAAFLDGNFEASLILIDDLWDRVLGHLVENTYAACVPTRDVLAFCDNQSAEGIQTLQNIVQRAAGGDHPITNTIFERRDGQWKIRA